MGIVQKAVTCLTLMLCLTAVGAAQINKHLKEEFHDPEAYGIQIIENLAGLRAALHDEDIRVLCFQSFNEEMTEEAHLELLEWVRAGRSVWFYDARLAPLFGMKPTMLTGEEFRNKPEEGVLGGKKRTGIATVGMSIGSHAVQTGVGQVTLFLPEIMPPESEEPVYGAILPEGDTHPLLQFELDSPALVACRREGHGYIVFKSLLWNEPLSGDRFQMNLLEYSAGYQVPGPAGVGKVGDPPGPTAEFVEGEPAVPLAASEVDYSSVTSPPPTENGEKPEKASRSNEEGNWSLELQDGTVVVGEFETELVEFETASNSLKLEPTKLQSVEFGSSIKLDKIVTINGKSHSGLLLSTPIRFRTSRGVEEFEKEDLIKLSRSEE